MSNQSENEKYLSESGKGYDEKFYEHSRTDSGFLSGNLPTEEIKSEDLSSGDLEEIPEVPSSKNPEPMRLDSGLDICLSQTFSDLSIDLKDPGLNDLNCKPKSHENPEPKNEEKAPNQWEWELYYRQDEDGDTQLHIAIYHNFLEVIYSLIRLTPHQCLLDIRNDIGRSALHCAAQGAQSNIARRLVAAGARKNVRDCAGDTPLHLACRNGDVNTAKAIVLPVKQEEIVQLGLEYEPVLGEIDLEQRNYDGEMCVHLAAMAGHVEILRHLVWFGANINAREGKSGYTPLHIALERRDTEMVRFLLEECSQLQIECRTYAGRTAIQLAPRGSLFEQALENKGATHEESESDTDSEYDSDSDQGYEASSNFYQTKMPINASA